MKQSLISKTILILGVVIIIIFIGAGYLFKQSDNTLINKIMDKNLHIAMHSLDEQKVINLKSNKEKIKIQLQ